MLMVESSDRNEYALLSPRERNLELRKLVRAFPTFTLAMAENDPGFHDMIVGLVDDAKSEGKEIDINDKGGIAEQMAVKVFQDFDRRQNSELKAAIFPKVKSLIALSSTTPLFRDAIKKRLDIDFGIGITTRFIQDDYEFPDDDYHLRVLFDLNNPESEGIFGSNPRQIERYFYSDMYYDEARPVTTTQDLASRLLRFLSWKKLARWRKQYKARYGEELKPLPPKF